MSSDSQTTPRILVNLQSVKSRLGQDSQPEPSSLVIPAHDFFIPEEHDSSPAKSTATMQKHYTLEGIQPYTLSGPPIVIPSIPYNISASTDNAKPHLPTIVADGVFRAEVGSTVDFSLHHATPFSVPMKRWLKERIQDEPWNMLSKVSTRLEHTPEGTAMNACQFSMESVNEFLNGQDSVEENDVDFGQRSLEDLLDCKSLGKAIR